MAVTLVLENCEYYEFDDKYVDIYLENIGLHKYGEWEPLKVARDCLILIEKDAKPLNELEDWQEVDWIKRIDKDITQIEINGERYFVNWADDEYENPYEKDSDYADSRAFLISKRAKTVDEFFDIIDRN